MLPMLSLLLACTDPDSAAKDSDTGGLDTDTGETAETGDSETAETDSGTAAGSGLKGRNGSAVATVDSFSDGVEEAWFVADEGDGADLCRVSYALEPVAPRDDCDLCSWAWDLQITGVTVLEDSDCATPGLDALEGTTRSYGYIFEYFGHANVIAEDDGGWDAQGFATWDEGSGAFEWEISDGTLAY